MMNLQSKKDFERLLLSLLNPLKSHYTKEKAGIELGDTMAHYDYKASMMEAFSRPLWGLVPFWAGGGRDEEFEQICQKGLTSGTNKNNKEYWGECKDFDQRFVEMAAIAYGIIFTPQVLWEPLSAQEKDNLCEYLYKINCYSLPECNWLLFAVLVNVALKKVGRPYSEEVLNRYLMQIETFYRGDGWYQDGDSGQKDYYISFAIHFYCLIYATVMEDEDPERAALYRERACVFARQFIYWFDVDGDGVPFGRSLTYRFAQISFFSACLVAGIEPFSLAEMKGLIQRHLESWLNKKMFDRDGILTIGYGYSNLIMAEGYNTPGSPYWCMKAFALLMLPDEHPFWQTEAAPYPELALACPMPYADMYVRHYGNHTTILAPGVYSPKGHGQTAAKYGKFAYDSKFGFSIAKSCFELHENAPDNMLAFVINGYVYVRRICQESKITETEVYSKWSPYPGITVKTTLVPNEEGHIRTHEIISDLECIAYDCGFAVNRGDKRDVDYQDSTGDHQAKSENRESLCAVTCLKGHGRGEVIYADANTNLLHPKTAIPAIRYEIKPGEQVIETRVEAEWMPHSATMSN